MGRRRESHEEAESEEGLYIDASAIDMPCDMKYFLWLVPPLHNRGSFDCFWTPLVEDAIFWQITITFTFEEPQ